MQVIEIAIAVLAVLSIVAFLLYMASLFRLPTGKRPRTPTFDRYGDALPPTTNPGFEETEDERASP